MRIKRIEIASFGKFKDFVMDFSDGFNLIYGSNEDGKSTIMAFIALMLYGGAGKASRTDFSKNIRKKYAPWSGERMSGDMEIEHCGRIYRVHKDFRATAKSDSVTVTDMETGERLALPPDTEVGTHFLGIGYEGFEKSIFGGAAEGFAGQESGDLSARLSNIAETGDEQISGKTVSERLEKARTELISKRGNQGLLVETENKIREIGGLLEVQRAQSARRAELGREYKETEAELETLNKKAEEIRKSAETAAKRQKARQYRELSGMLADLENREKGLRERLRGENPKEFLQTVERLRRNLEIAKENLKNFPEAESYPAVSQEDMRKYLALREEQPKAESEKAAATSVKTQGGIIGIIIGIIIFAAGIVGGIFSPYLFIAAAAGAVVAAICVIRERKTKAEFSAAKERADKISAEISSLLEAAGCETYEEFESAYRMTLAAAEKGKLREEAASRLKSAEETFAGFLEKYGISDISAGVKFSEEIQKETENLAAAENSAAAYGKTVSAEQMSAEELINLAQDTEKDLPEEETAENGEETAAMIRAKNARLLDIKGQMGALPADIGENERKLAELCRRRDEMRAYYDALSLAAEVMEEAADEISRSFGPQISRRAAEITEKLTGGRYTGVTVSKTYEIEVKTGGAEPYRNWQYLSRGACAQAYLALRIAVCELLEDGGEKMPLMLDDVLADYDGQRGAAAAEFIEDYAIGGRQVLFFTCHGWKGKTNESLKLSE